MARRSHRGHHGCCHPPRAPELLIHHAHRVFERCLLHRPEMPRARVADQRVDLTVTLNDMADGDRNQSVALRVQLQYFGCRTQLGQPRLERRTFSEVSHRGDHAVTAQREQCSGFQPNAARGSGDEDRFHLSSF